MTRRRHWQYAAIGSAALVVGGGLLVTAPWTSRPEDPFRSDADATAARITAAASADRGGEPGRSAVPGVEAAPVLRDRVTAVEPRSADPPEGYSFVRHAGEMRKARTGGPPRGEPSSAPVPDWLDPAVGVPALAQLAADAGRGWSFGWIRLAHGASRSGLERALAGAGGEVVGGPGRMIRTRFPGNAARLAAIASLDAVAGIGAQPPDAKLAAFADGGPQPSDGAMPVYVTLMADDTDGRWRRGMERLGVVVGGYDAELRAYRANADRDAIRALAEADFVLSVEPVPLVRASHDTAVPAMGADALRTHDGAPGLFVGTDGATVPIAVMDTGLNVAHPDIASHRDSVCGANFAYNSWRGPDGPVVEEDDLWVDSDGHGTHVTGTVAGNGFGGTRFAGMAPGVRHIRFAKVLDSHGAGTGDSVRQGMDFLGGESGCMVDGEPSERVKPLIVNMSLAATARIFEGRDFGARKLDATVWSHRQLYVVAQSNAGVHGFSNFGAAKNSLSVGAATDGGALASFSSHGPTADGRLAPNVVGTGVRVHSAKGDGSRGGYHALNGTSMASPAVAGVAALLMDAAPAHKERPALARARLMASALRPDPWLDEGSGFRLDNTDGPGAVQARFGMGKVSARTAVLDRDRPNGWRSGSATSEVADGEYAWHDIEVPAGASRLDLVMIWDEPPADAVASTVLNDLDLWLDRDGDCAAAACGERASRSRVDSVEWIVVRDPEPGVWRAKVVAHRVFTDAPRAALAWTVVRGASTPTLSVQADRERMAGPGEHELTLTLTADAYVAAGTRLHVDCRSVGASPCNDLASVESVTLWRQDGVAANLQGEARRPAPDGFSTTPRPVQFGASIPVGEIAVGERREMAFRVNVAEGVEADASLHFTASAWNGRAGSVAVAVGSADPPDVARPDNDAFAAALAIDGREGSASLDMLHASPEPGEPVVDPWNGRPAGSVWYQWTAPEDGPFRFAVTAPSEHTEDNGGIARYDHLHVFQGDAVSGLRETASGLWRATFVAERGQPYVVRVAASARGAAMDLLWSPGERPANDDFADAVRLEGESGSVEGGNADATLEPGESFGTLAATTWYRWTAPEDGRWKFRTRGRRVVLVFEGDHVADLRLVGGYPASTADLPAGEGREYRIAVASNSPEGGGAYSLAWSTTGPPWDNDDFLDAEDWGGSPSRTVAVNSSATVEPGEPAETGVRTRWWNWQAPDEGRYTWRLEDEGETLPRYPKLQLRIFRGDALELLEPAAQIGPGGPFETVLETRAGETWRISAGVGDGAEAAFNQFFLSGRLVWGTTPANDESAGALPISGTSGSVSGSTRFATGAAGERSAEVGRSTLWWSYEADESRWVRFAVDSGDDWVLTVHRAAADGSGGLDVVTSSRLQYGADDVAAVVFLAERGVRYTISLGVADGGRDGEFTLRWDETDDPGWLRYVGRVADGGPDSRGDPVEIRSPAALAVNASGTALYLASELGLQVFGRDPATGGLSYRQLLDAGPFLGDTRLLWDPSRDRLVADECGSWRSFVPVGDGPELEDLGAMEAVDDPGTCALGVLMDGDGSHIYRIGSGRLQHFVVEDEGGLRFADSVDFGGDLLTAVLSNSGGHLYARTRYRLSVYERDPDSGGLTSVGDGLWFSSQYWADLGPQTRMPLAVTEDDAFLFAFDGYGSRTRIYSLDDPAAPDSLATLEPFWERNWGSASDYCRFADTRREIAAVDAFCPGLAFTAKWDPEARRLSGTDAVVPSVPEGDGPLVPEFDAPVDLAVAPDGRHLYLATPREGILIFAREAGYLATDADGSPDLAVQRVWSTPVSPPAGSTFKLSALVRNRGSGRSAGAMLGFHRSGDATVSPSDPAVGSAPLGVVDPAGTRSRSVEVEAPPSPGTYHYGACIEGGQECSDAVDVTVTEALPGAPDLVVEAVSVDAPTVDPGVSFALTAVVRNVGDAAAPGATLRYFRSDNATISTGDAEVGTDKIGGLASGADRDVAVTLTAPEEGGIHYYGACADAVEGEVRTRDNCSDSVAVEVSGGDGGGQDDDHGDSIGDATPLSIPSTTDAELGEEGDSDYFRVEVGEPTTLTVETEGGTDTYGTLFDANGISLASDDDGGFSLNFRIERGVDAGTYYVEVRGFSDSTTGPYTLRVRADDGGEEATHCRPGGTVEPEGSCAIYGTSHTFDVDAGGEGCLNAGFSLCSGGSVSYRSASLTFVAERLDNDSWEVEDVDPAPPD